MFPTSCILLCAAVTVAVTSQDVFTYAKPWNPFRRSATECEMCYKGDCVVTRGPRCEYYAEASKLISDDDDDADDKVERDVLPSDDKIDNMLFDLVDSASFAPHFKGCIPLVSQYTDCTEENICIGCKFCSCSEVGSWKCNDKHKCRPEPKLTIDHRVIGIVIENLKKRVTTQERRVKRGVDAINTAQRNVTTKTTYEDLSKWMYGVDPQNRDLKDVGIGDILDYLKSNKTIFDGYTDHANVTPTVTSEPIIPADTFINKSDNYVDLLEFNDILETWTTSDISTKNPLTNPTQTVPTRHLNEIYINDVDYSEYDPIRLIKRDTSRVNGSENLKILQTNTTRSNFTYGLILTEALGGLNKITTEKRKELEELMNIQNNLLNIAKTHNINIDMNSSISSDNYNKHHIAIYKLDTLEKCVTNIKHDICNAIKNVFKTDAVSNSSELQRDLKLITSTIKKYIFRENNENVNSRANILSSHEYGTGQRRHVKPENIQQNLNPIKYVSDILEEINKVKTNPLRMLSQHSRKIIKRVIKQLYLDDFAVIDFIVHETYYDFDNYLHNIGTKWRKLMQDIIDSDVFDVLYRIKLLHITLRADISKMEDMITLLDFARNRRMTIGNGLSIDKSISRIQSNLQLIDSNVQKILTLEKHKKMRQAAQKTKPTNKKSILQKLKKMFQSSKNDIKEMLRKRFPKSEIMKRIAKKKMAELEKRRMLEYQETMKQWQEHLNGVPGREKRSAWGFQAFADRIKSIIPGYLRGKVKPGLQKKKRGNKFKTAKYDGRQRKTDRQPTTIKITAISHRSTESYQRVSNISF